MQDERRWDENAKTPVLTLVTEEQYADDAAKSPAEEAE